MRNMSVVRCQVVDCDEGTRCGGRPRRGTMASAKAVKLRPMEQSVPSNTSRAQQDKMLERLISVVDSVAGTTERGKGHICRQCPQKGDKVEFNYRGKGCWYPGRISRVNADGTFNVDYDDGEKETRLEESLVRAVSGGSLSRERFAAEKSAVKCIHHLQNHVKDHSEQHCGDAGSDISDINADEDEDPKDHISDEDEDTMSSCYIVDQDKEDERWERENSMFKRLCLANGQSYLCAEALCDAANDEPSLNGAELYGSWSLRRFVLASETVEEPWQAQI